jgi:hypothetical protein
METRCLGIKARLSFPPCFWKWLVQLSWWVFCSLISHWAPQLAGTHLYHHILYAYYVKLHLFLVVLFLFDHGGLDVLLPQYFPWGKTEQVSWEVLWNAKENEWMPLLLLFPLLRSRRIFSVWCFTTLQEREVQHIQIEVIFPIIIWFSSSYTGKIFAKMLTSLMAHL